MELYLLRHGRSLANTANLVTGRKTDILCPEGQKQARAASTLLRYFEIESGSTVSFVSDWERAKETAALAAPDMSFIIDARLGETNAGTAAAMSLDEFNQTHPVFWSSFKPDRPYPGGESHADLYARVLEWQEELEHTVPAGVKVLAVTHAGPICCLLHAACKTDMTHFPTFLATNASLTKLERTGTAPWRLVFFSLSLEVTA